MHELHGTEFPESSCDLEPLSRAAVEPRQLVRKRDFSANRISFDDFY